MRNAETTPVPGPVAARRALPESPLLIAARGQRPDRSPIWFMRQAGRCLADYRRLRERYPIMTLAKTPELCAEVTMMPVTAFGVDAAVLFADI
ncbi:MAG: uroporphyrinogen decarboxylase, partial [Pseudonocardiaceae bacterium]|nr:uroporphyrinogen decarboxylase [Pseudonocardiaceae bacterium]